MLAAQLVLRRVGVVDIVGRIAERHVRELPAEHPLDVGQHRGVAAQQAVVAQDPEVARLADRLLRRLRNLVLGLVARRLAVGDRQQPLQLRGIEADQVEVEALVPAARPAPPPAARRPSPPAGRAGCRRSGRPASAPRSRCSNRITGTSASPSLRAASSRPWPARMPAFSSTRIGLVQPNSTIEAAIWSTCASLCVRGLRSYGRRRSIGHSSIRSASATRGPAALGPVLKTNAVMPCWTGAFRGGHDAASSVPGGTQRIALSSWG